MAQKKTTLISMDCLNGGKDKAAAANPVTTPPADNTDQAKDSNAKGEE
jgi:hypothetical protein